MRDVTDNVTVDLPGMEQKRGRGRPRKAHAMTNAERQAAYRARRRAQQPADRSVTVTKMPVEVDAYDECRLEVERLRAELVALRLKAERHEVERNNVFALADLKEDQRQEALTEAEGLRIQLSKALGEVQRLNSKKSVTRSNVNSSSGLFAEIKRSSKYYGQSERGELFAVSLLARGEYVVQGGPGGQYRLKDVWLWAVDAEDPARRVRLG
ncbi:hypothetical protein ACI2TU_13685 [Ralstonia nicotianae]